MEEHCLKMWWLIVVCFLDFSANDCQGTALFNSDPALSSKEGNQAFDKMAQTVQGLDQASAVAVDQNLLQQDRSNPKTEQVVRELDLVDYETDMVKTLKVIFVTAQDMIYENPSFAGFGQLIIQLKQHCHTLALQTVIAVQAVSNQEVAENIITTVEDVENACVDLEKNAGEVQSSPSNPFFKEDLRKTVKKSTEKVSLVLAALEAGSSGAQACIAAAKTVSDIIGDLDTAITTLSPEHDTSSFADHREDILNAAWTLEEDTKTLASSATGSVEQLAIAAQSAVGTIKQLSDIVKLSAASLGIPDGQVILNAAKDVAYALDYLISSSMMANGKPRSDPAVLPLTQSAKLMLTNVDSLLKIVESMEDKATAGISTTSKPVPEDEEVNFIEHQTDMVETLKSILKTAQDMVKMANSDASKLGMLTKQLLRLYNKLTQTALDAQAATTVEMSEKINNAVGDLGNACIDLAESGGAVQSSPNDHMAKIQLSDCLRNTAEKVRLLYAVLKTGFPGMDVDAVKAVLGIIDDLDTAITCALVRAVKLHTPKCNSMAGAPISAEPGIDSFSDYRKSILRTAKALFNDTRALVLAAAESQEQLAIATQSVVGTITQLADAVKSGAATLGGDNIGGQVALINTVKEVASALFDLISSTNTAAGNRVDESAKVMVLSLTSLLKTVDSVEDGAVVGWSLVA